MSEEQAKPKAGWGWPLNSAKAHYFGEDARSLCGKWMFFGLLEMGNDESPDNCVACRRKQEKLVKTK